MRVRKKWHWVFIAPAMLAALAVFIYFGGTVVRLLWNWLLPPLFGWRAITFWQALGILALCRILFGGRGFNTTSGPKREVSREIGNRIVDRIADRFAEKWDDMSPEDRERLRQRVRERCGFDPAVGTDGTP